MCIPESEFEIPRSNLSSAFRLAAPSAGGTMRDARKSDTRNQEGDIKLISVILSRASVSKVAKA
jgi:hypothetical protein